MVKILGDPFDEYVHTQINVRQASLAKKQKSDDDIKVFNTSTPWIRLSSSIEVSKDRAEILAPNLAVPVADVVGNALAKKLVLFAGTTDGKGGTQRGGVGYGFNNAYGFLSDPGQGYKPMPGIISISTTYKSNGSLKQAQVKLKCYTRKQFEALEAIYLRLGYTMILEYGHSVYFTNKNIKENMSSLQIPNVLFHEVKVDPEKVAQNAAAQVTGDQTAKDVAYHEAKQKATAAAKKQYGAGNIRGIFEENKIKTGGNYDALLAKVANYSWSLGNDLSYDITLDLISLGDIIDSLKMNLGGSTEITPPYEAKADAGIQNLVNIKLQRSTGRFVQFLQELTDLLGSPDVLKNTSEATQEKTKALDKTLALAKIQNGYEQRYLDTVLAIEAKIISPYEKVQNWLRTQDVKIVSRIGNFDDVLLTKPIPPEIELALGISGLAGLFNRTEDLNRTLTATYIAGLYLLQGQTILKYYGLTWKNSGDMLVSAEGLVSTVYMKGTLIPDSSPNSEAFAELKKDLDNIKKAVREAPDVSSKEGEDSTNNESQIEAFSKYSSTPLEVIKYLVYDTGLDIKGLATLENTLHTGLSGTAFLHYSFLVSRRIANKPL